MWQELREELHPRGLEVVTVALDTGGVEAAKPFVDKAAPTHPSLLDEAHLVDELFGVVNVPNGVRIDEDGVIDRPAEPAGRQPGPASTLSGPATARTSVAIVSRSVTPGAKRQSAPASRYALSRRAA